jgi:hypothetical protein
MNELDLVIILLIYILTKKQLFHHLFGFFLKFWNLFEYKHTLKLILFKNKIKIQNSLINIKTKSNIQDNI